MRPPPSRRTLLAAALGGAFAVAGASPAEAEADDAGTSTAGSTALTVDPRAHGVVGDGVADDAAAINALIQTLASGSGGVIQFPQGSFLVRSPVMLASGVQLVTSTPNHGYIAAQRSVSSTVLVAAAGLTGPVVDSPATPLVAAGISGIDIQANGAAVGVQLRDPSWCVVERVHVDHTRGPGVMVGGGMASVFSDVLITNAVLDRSPGAVVGAFDLSGTDHYVDRCEFSASLSGRTAQQRCVAAAIRGANHFVADSVAEASDVGWWISAGSTRFSNVRGDTNQAEGFVVGGWNNVFAACSSIGNSQMGDGAADAWLVSGGANSFAACNVVTSSSTRVRHGFNDTVNDKDAAARNSYAACHVDRSAATRWRTEGFLGSSPSLPANAIRPASGTTRIDVTQAGLVVLFDYTRRTTVRAFTGGVNGQTLRVLGSDRVTIAPGATIVTSNGRSLRLRRRGVTTFVCYDGVWYQS